MSGLTDEPQRFVLIAGDQTCYPEAAFQDAFGEAFLGLLAVTIRQGSTSRAAARAVKRMKNEATHTAVLSDALKRLRRSDGCSVEEVSQRGGTIVATFLV